MQHLSRKSVHFALAITASLCVLENPLRADELSELYLGTSSSSSSSAIPPNILIVLDTSGSMTNHDLDFVVDPAKVLGAYDPAKTYPGPCNRNYAFRRSFSTDRNGDGIVDLNDINEDDFASCTGDQRVPLYAVACDAVLRNGAIVDHIGEFRAVVDGTSSHSGTTLDGEWYSMTSDFNGIGHFTDSGGKDVIIWRECATDYGVHGINGFSSKKYPSDSGTSDGWTDNVAAAVDVSNRTRQLFAAGNYINWFRWTQTRLAAVQAALRDVILELPEDTRLGIMRFDVKIEDLGETSSQGGYMIKEFVRLGDSDNRQDVIDTVLSIEPAGDGGTPLGETLFEALQVFRGGDVVFGADAHSWNIDTNTWPWDGNTTTYASRSSVAPSLDSIDDSKYKTPIIYECQKSAVIFLSDGDPDGDKNTWNYFENLPGSSGYAANDCDTSSSPESCMREVAEYMANEDVSELSGLQTVTTYTVGFGDSISADGQQLLQETATRGGGSFTMADSYESLTDAFRVIFRTEIAANQTLSSPAVTVNAFNRLAHDDEIYFTMFNPAFDSLHWAGNLKKYRLAKVGGQFRIVDATGSPALVDNSSEVAYDALSFWTDTSDPEVIANQGADGDVTTLGGAAGELTDTHLASRKLYSWYGDTSNRSLTSIANAFNASNTSNAMLGLGMFATAAYEQEVVAWISGIDTTQSDWTTNPKSRRAVGGSPHGVPAIVTYGGTEAAPEQIIYTPTNDGFLHAIDAATGQELWAFIPTEVMPMFADMYDAPATSYIGYGLDASIVTHVDSGSDTDISTTSADEHAWLFFGMRRGGKSLYALDVTDRRAPKIMWRIQGGDLDGDGTVNEDFHFLAQTWSQPQLAYVQMDASDSTGKPVLIFGGGYDAATQDSSTASLGYVDDTAGNAVYIVDAETGALLWWAGPAGSGADLELADMKSSIAADIEVKDKNEDGFADLLYVADLGGRIFRLDVGTTANSVAVTGGMIATLGGAASTGLADNRKFFAKPDVVLVAQGDTAYNAVNIGSGDRARPKSNMSTNNWLFSIKDPNVSSAPASYAYGIDVTDLYDVTDNTIQDGATQADKAAALASLNAADGWKLRLEHAGEKAVSEAKTFNFRVFFTTFDPTPLDAGACNTDPGTARMYTLDLVTATAVLHEVNEEPTKDDRETVLTHGTIPPGMTLLFLEDENGNTDVTGITGRSDAPPDLGDDSAVRKTFWHIESNEDTEQ